MKFGKRIQLLSSRVVREECVQRIDGYPLWISHLNIREHDLNPRPIFRDSNYAKTQPAWDSTQDLEKPNKTKIKIHEIL